MVARMASTSGVERKLYVLPCGMALRPAPERAPPQPLESEEDEFLFSILFCKFVPSTKGEAESLSLRW